ncbi:hypothetical protein HDU97_009879 [Phlyctochytrium planicorne]|nr:hypothetical protein HDU97_009879 [Phlyctochytrium planicorne]
MENDDGLSRRKTRETNIKNQIDRIQKKKKELESRRQTTSMIVRIALPVVVGAGAIVAFVFYVVSDISLESIGATEIKKF